MSNQPVSAYTVVRELLTENLDLPSDQIIARAKERGVARSDDDLRRVINNTRSDLRARTKQKKPARAKAPSPYTITRELLTADPGLSNDAIFARIKARGVSKSDSDIRGAIRHTRSDMLNNGPKPVPAAARIATEPNAPTVPMVSSAPAAPAAPTDEALFSVIGLANKTAQLCGGVTKARAIAEAIRSCGGLDMFLRRLDLIAEILGSETEL